MLRLIPNKAMEFDKDFDKGKDISQSLDFVKSEKIGARTEKGKR
jgi:hypothetical protein